MPLHNGFRKRCVCGDVHRPNDQALPRDFLTIPRLPPLCVHRRADDTFFSIKPSCPANAAAGDLLRGLGVATIFINIFCRLSLVSLF